MRIKTSVWNHFNTDVFWDSLGLQSDASLLFFYTVHLSVWVLSVGSSEPRENKIGQTNKGFCFPVSLPLFVPLSFAQRKTVEKYCTETRNPHFSPFPWFLSSHVKSTTSNHPFYKCLINLLFVNKLDLFHLQLCP